MTEGSREGFVPFVEERGAVGGVFEEMEDISVILVSPDEESWPLRAGGVESELSSSGEGDNSLKGVDCLEEERL